MKTARQEILDKLRKAGHALPKQPDFNAPVYHAIKKPLEIAFKKNLEEVNGSVHLFSSESELYDGLKTLLTDYDGTICCAESKIQLQLKKFEIGFSSCDVMPENIAVGITGCEFLIAHTGSVMVSSAQQGGRQIFVYPPVHLVIASKSQLVDYLDKAYSGIQKKYKKNLPSQLTLITGPSRTADIEKTLILGAHGPKELHVFIA